MRKMITLATILTVTFLVACSRPAPQNQVFGDNGGGIMTISQVKSQYDDALVTFTGNIIRQVEGEEYIVSDSTGDIRVEIDHHVWNGLNVTPKDTVRIYGKVDKEFLSTQVDAYSIEKVQ